MDFVESNALENEVVIHQISCFLPWEDLKTCRQLSKPWYGGCQEQWLQRGPVKELYKQQQNNGHGAAIGKNSAAVLLGVEWSSCAKWPGALKYRKFMLEGFSIDSNWNPTYSDFWKTRGDFITTLEIRDCVITSENACVDLLLCKATPNLKTLKLVRVQFTFSTVTSVAAPLDGVTKAKSGKKLQILEIQYNDNCKNVPISWVALFECYSKLQDLRLANYNKSDNESELGRVLEGLDAFLLRNRTRHPLKHLHVLNISTLDVCGSMSLPLILLEKFREQSKPGANISLALEDLGAGTNWMRSGHFHELIELVALHGFLTRLVIKEGFAHDDSHDDTHIPKIAGVISLPRLDNLRRLDLWDYELRSLQFLINCPSLKDCNIIANATLPAWYGWRNNNIIRDDDDTVSGWGSKEKKEIHLPYLTSFHFNHHMNFDGSDLEVLARWMPNLESLMVSVAHCGVESLWTNFRKLHRLFICNSQVTDQGFTGINVTKSELQVLDLETYERRANLTYLSVLKELVVEKQKVSSNAFQWPGSTPTELAVREAFCKTPSLKKLYISPQAITEAGMTVLKSEFKGQLNTTMCPSALDFINY